MLYSSQSRMKTSQLESINVTINGVSTELRFAMKIGRGTYATVWKAENVDNDSVYAVKLIENKFSEAVCEAQKEAMMLKSLDSSYVACAYDCYEGDDKLAIVMDYFELGSLETIFKRQKS